MVVASSADASDVRVERESAVEDYRTPNDLISVVTGIRDEPATDTIFTERVDLS